MENCIIINGAAGAVGSRLCHYYRDLGMPVVQLYHHRPPVLPQGPGVYALALDLDNGDTDPLLDLLNHDHLYPWGLVHAAAVRASDHLPLTDSDPRQWQTVFNANVMPAYLLLRALIPLMRPKGGRVVLFSSLVGRSGLASGSAYAAGKAALTNLAKSVAAEEGANNILVNTVSPGPIQITNPDFDPDYAAFRDQYYAKEATRLALGRVALPEEFIGICTYLLSQQNTYLTGEDIALHGGRF